MTLYAQALANYGDVMLNPDASKKDRDDAQFALTAARKAAELGEHTLSPQQLEALATVTDGIDRCHCPDPSHPQE